MIIPVKTSQGSYDIILERGSLKKVQELLDLNRKVLIVTDDGVPEEYSQAVFDASKDASIFCFPCGEASKHMKTYSDILAQAVELGLTRTDCIVAVGGGVVGDMAGFAAATYMRGIDFYNIPTTLLSQVDSSIGGKTAIDFHGIKNVIGAFYPPKRVIIDPDTLSTLPQRQLSNGLAESVKMSLTSDAELFEIFENTDHKTREFIDAVIERSLLIKRSVVEADEHESGLRKILNFGHTVGHAIESANGMEKLYHGECVALGMLSMCSERVRKRLLPVLEKLSLPTSFEASPSQLAEACRHDKKASGDSITVVYVSEVGSFEMTSLKLEEFEKMLEKAVCI